MQPSDCEPKIVSPTGSPVVKMTGGVRTIIQHLVLPPCLRPYPFTIPTPAPRPSELDGTYLRILTFKDTGGVVKSLPIRCLRCIPFKVDPGVSTLVLYKGAYYVNHQLSGFTSLGNIAVAGDRATFFNDPNCPTTRGVYTWSLRGRSLTFRAVSDTCPFGTERARDLTFARWIQVDACVYRISGLWPAALGCG
jgi:hypothetical protein